MRRSLSLRAAGIPESSRSRCCCAAQTTRLLPFPRPASGHYGGGRANRKTFAAETTTSAVRRTSSGCGPRRDVGTTIPELHGRSEATLGLVVQLQGVLDTFAEQVQDFTGEVPPIDPSDPGGFRGRNAPDISENANYDAGYTATYTPDTGVQRTYRYGGGISYVAPQMPAATALMNELSYRRLGFLNPGLYRLDRQHQIERLGDHSAPGQDIVPLNPWNEAKFGSTWDPRILTRRGYDQTTGLGIPNFGALYKTQSEDRWRALGSRTAWRSTVGFGSHPGHRPPDDEDRFRCPYGPSAQPEANCPRRLRRSAVDAHPASCFSAPALAGAPRAWTIHGHCRVRTRPLPSRTCPDNYRRIKDFRDKPLIPMGLRANS